MICTSLAKREAILDALASRVRDELRGFGFKQSEEMMLLKARIAISEAWDAGYDEATTVLNHVYDPNA